MQTVILEYGARISETRRGSYYRPIAQPINTAMTFAMALRTLGAPRATFGEYEINPFNRHYSYFTDQY